MGLSTAWSPEGVGGGSLPKSVFSLGKGLSSVEAWFSTALDIEEVLSGTGGDQLHVVVADVIKSFDTVDRCDLDCALGRLGLLAWFRRVYFSYHSHVRLRFKLAAGLGALVWENSPGLSFEYGFHCSSLCPLVSSS